MKHTRIAGTGGATVSYDRQTINVPNPLARFAHKNRIAVMLEMARRLLPPNGAMVDFGAGTGNFLSKMADARPDARLFAVEPFMPRSTDKRFIYLDRLADAERPDLIVAMDVCEHLRDPALTEFIDAAAAALPAHGRVLISVPIMQGLALVPKELNRIILFRRPSDYSIRDLIVGTFGGAVQRPDDPGPTHKGFDFRWLRGHLATRFEIEREMAGPLPLPWWCNSEAYFVCRLRR